MNRFHVQALTIATLMVCIAAVAFSFAPPAARGPEMFFAVVQLAGTIAAGVVGNAMGALRRRRDLIRRGDHATLTSPEKKIDPRNA